jgi:hypothetical protein
MLHQPVRAAYAQTFELRQPQPELGVLVAQVSLPPCAELFSKLAPFLHPRHGSGPPTQPFAIGAGAPLKSQNMSCGGKKKSFASKRRPKIQAFLSVCFGLHLWVVS